MFADLVIRKKTCKKTLAVQRCCYMCCYIYVLALKGLSVKLCTTAPVTECQIGSIAPFQCISYNTVMKGKDLYRISIKLHQI